MEIKLEEEIIEKLTFKGTLAYIGIVRRGSGTWSTAHLAMMVGCKTEMMREGLEELSTHYPGIVSKEEKKWVAGLDVKTPAVQSLDWNARRVMFIDDLKKIWDWANPEQKFTLGPADGSAINHFLRQRRDWDTSTWRKALRHRFQSEVNRAQAPYTWMSRLGEYLDGPLDRYGKPMTQGIGGRIGQALETEAGNRASRDAFISSQRI